MQMVGTGLHPDAFGGAFTELHTGVDHLGLAASSREELEQWERRPLHQRLQETLADLWADAHYGVMAEKLREKGIGIYAEAAGVSLEMPEDTLLNKSKVEIPMGEFWVRDLHPRLMYFQDVRGAASAAHVYGKPLVGAEAFTGGGYESPFTLKKVADYWLAQGINRLVFHTSAHQPLDTKPGNTMVGTHLNRNITWAEQAQPLMTYFARSSHLLQQGMFVADLAYLLNEGAPSTPPIWGAGTQPTPPEGHDYDFINADVLLNRLSVAADGRLVLPDGMSYRLLVLPETDRMRPELLRKLRDLVASGATITGRRPLRSPSLANYPAADAEVEALAAELWGDLDGVSRTIRYFGKGRVVWGRPPAETLASIGVVKDFDYAKGLDAQVAWLHRRTPAADIYYVVNSSDQAREFDARFRIAGKDLRYYCRLAEASTSAAFIAQAASQTLQMVKLPERQMRPADAPHVFPEPDEYSVKSFLSSFVVRLKPDYRWTEDGLFGVDWHSSPSSLAGSMEGIHVPTLMVSATCAAHIVFHETAFDKSPAKDKEYIGVEGANHGFTPCKPEFGDTFTRTFDYVDAWLMKPGRVLN